MKLCKQTSVETKETMRVGKNVKPADTMEQQGL